MRLRAVFLFKVAALEHCREFRKPKLHAEEHRSSGSARTLELTKQQPLPATVATAYSSTVAGVSQFSTLNTPE